MLRFRENFLPKGAMADRVAHNLRLNAGVNISGVQLSDTGYYGVQVTVATKDEQGNQLSETFTASALLTVVGNCRSLYLCICVTQYLYVALKKKKRKKKFYSKTNKDVYKVSKRKEHQQAGAYGVLSKKTIYTVLHQYDG